MPRLTWLNHAGFLLEQGSVRLATDPWCVGDAFRHGWRLVCEAPLPAEELAGATHLWFSHEHADHFSPATLRAIAPEARQRIRVLYQRTRDGALRDYCRGLGFAEVVELADRQWQALGADFRVQCGHWFAGDSWLLVEAGGKRFLNLNDCICDDAAELRALARSVGRVDVLLAQFAVGGWLGNPEEAEWRTREPEAALRALGVKCRTLAPRQAIPGASFFYFSHEENFYLNDALVSPARAVQTIEAAGCEPVVLCPGDRWELGAPWPGNAPNVERYERDFAQRLAAGPIAHAGAPIAVETLCAEAASFCRRMHAANPGWKLMRHRPLLVGFFEEPMPVLRLDKNGLAVASGNAVPDIRLASESLLNCLRDLRGANSLRVNGRFRARDRRSMDAFFELFAVAAANRRGYFYTVPYLAKRRMRQWGGRVRGGVRALLHAMTTRRRKTKSAARRPG